MINKQYGCVQEGSSYGCVYIGIGLTPEQALKTLQGMLDNAGDDPVEESVPAFYELIPLEVEIQKTVEIKIVRTGRR